MVRSVPQDGLEAANIRRPCVHVLGWHRLVAAYKLIVVTTLALLRETNLVWVHRAYWVAKKVHIQL